MGGLPRPRPRGGLTTAGQPGPGSMGGTWLSKLAQTFSSTGPVSVSLVLTGWVSIRMWVTLSKRSAVELTHGCPWSPLQSSKGRGRESLASWAVGDTPPPQGHQRAAEREGWSPPSKGCKTVAWRPGPGPKPESWACRPASQAQHRPQTPPAGVLPGHWAETALFLRPAAPPCPSAASPCLTTGEHKVPPQGTVGENPLLLRKRNSLWRGPLASNQLLQDIYFPGRERGGSGKGLQRQTRVRRKPRSPEACGQLTELASTAIRPVTRFPNTTEEEGKETAHSERKRLPPRDTHSPPHTHPHLRLPGPMSQLQLRASMSGAGLRPGVDSSREAGPPPGQEGGLGCVHVRARARVRALSHSWGEGEKKTREGHHRTSRGEVGWQA